MAFLGLLNPATKRATAFYAGLGVALHHIWTHGLDKWGFALLVLFCGLGSLSGLARLIHGGEDPPNKKKDQN